LSKKIFKNIFRTFSNIKYYFQRQNKFRKYVLSFFAWGNIRILGGKKESLGDGGRDFSFEIMKNSLYK
jgi:hypothetical protein